MEKKEIIGNFLVVIIVIVGKNYREVKTPLSVDQFYYPCYIL